MTPILNENPIPSFTDEVQRLKDRHRLIRDQFPETLNLRVHRSLSWLMRAAALNDAQDHDTAFILLWIAFNAIYGERSDQVTIGERTIYKRFFDRIISIDDKNQVYDAIWQQFAETIRTLLRNQYVFEAYWRSINAAPPNEAWKATFETSNRKVRRAIATINTSTLLTLLFDRLYVLRNQILHGGATWNSSTNRSQIQDSVRILSFLVPIFVELMMMRPDMQWSKPYYHNVQA